MTDDRGASLLTRLLNLAKERGEDYNLVLNRFGLERLLCHLAAPRHVDRFLLKGALLFSLWYDEPHRPTRDADLLGFGPADIDSLVATFREIVAIELNDGIAFDARSVRASAIRETAEYGGVRVRLSGRINNVRLALQIDVGNAGLVEEPKFLLESSARVEDQALFPHRGSQRLFGLVVCRATGGSLCRIVAPLGKPLGATGQYLRDGY